MKSRRVGSAVAVGLVGLLLSSCWELTNPLDPDGDNYQGYLTVTSVDEVGPETPADGDTVAWLPSFVCTDCSSANLYWLQISSSSGEFQDHLVYDDAGLTTRAMAVSDAAWFTAGETYYWRVCARDAAAGEWGAWSDVWSFTAGGGVSATGISPPDGGGTMDTTPLLSWNALDGAASYEVQIAESEAALAEAEVLDAAGAEYQIAAALSVGDVRYWRVRGVNEDAVPGAWSAVWSFEVIENPVTAVNTSLTSNGLDMEMVVVISTDSDSYRDMTLTRYAVSETEVTQGDYEAVIGSNPSSSYGVGTDYPVYYVSWYDAVEFCNALSALCGLEAVYDTGDWSADFTKSGFYLPTEAQWEYAAGGPNHYTWSLGDTFVESDYVFDDSQTRQAKSHPANGFGLYDMSGNVYEWCHDWSGGTYPHTGETDPTGPSSGSYRVLRGGSWTRTYSAGLRCDYRTYDSPGGASSGIGFRMAVGGHGLW